MTQGPALQRAFLLERRKDMGSVLERLKKTAGPASRYGKDPDQVREVDEEHIHDLERSMEANLAGNARRLSESGEYLRGKFIGY